MIGCRRWTPIPERFGNELCEHGGVGLKIDDFRRGTLEGPRLRQHGQGVVKGLSVGPDPPHSQQDHHPPVSLILYTDSRISEYRIQDILQDTPMQDTGIKGWRCEDAGLKDIGYSRFIFSAAWWPLYEGPADIYIYTQTHIHYTYREA